MLAVAHEARLGRRTDPKDANSPTHRAVWEELADKGDVRADAALQEPTYPAEIHYLREWSSALFGRSGSGMDGIAPLSHTTLAHWQQNAGVRVTPAEIDALMLLDAVRRDPSIVKDAKAATKLQRNAASRWPKKKVVA